MAATMAMAPRTPTKPPRTANPTPPTSPAKPGLTDDVFIDVDFTDTKMEAELEEATTPRTPPRTPRTPCNTAKSTPNPSPAKPKVGDDPATFTIAFYKSLEDDAIKAAEANTTKSSAQRRLFW